MFLDILFITDVLGNFWCIWCEKNFISKTKQNYKQLIHPRSNKYLKSSNSKCLAHGSARGDFTQLVHVRDMLFSTATFHQIKFQMPNVKSNKLHIKCTSSKFKGYLTCDLFNIHIISTTISWAMLLSCLVVVVPNRVSNSPFQKQAQLHAGTIFCLLLSYMFIFTQKCVLKHLLIYTES